MAARALWGAGLLLVFLCSFFTLAGTFFVCWFMWRNVTHAEQELFPGLIARLVLFGGLTVVSMVLLLRGTWARGDAFPAPGLLPSWVRYSGWVLLAVLVLTLFVPRLGVYPWAAPDEVHHLTVAKNIAVHHAYASGHPDRGLDYFDTYDSVGAPVLFPVAAVIKIFGVDLVAARAVMAGYFLLLLLAGAWFMLPLTGLGGAVWPAVLLCIAFSSVYLGRTLYGEVPALFYFLLGLIAWRRSMNSAAWPFAILAGAAFGLAVLSKTLMVLTAFAFVTAWLWDWKTERRIGLAQIAGTAAGGAGVLAAWWCFEALASGDISDNAGDTAGLYYHYLLFGVEPVWNNLRYAVLPYFPAHVAVAAGYGWLFHRALRMRSDPAMLVLLLSGCLYFYWWVFFTPGQLARYLWICYAVGGLALGAMIHHLLASGFQQRRLRNFVMALLLTAPFIHWVSGQYRELYTKDEMSDEYALAGHLRGYPPGTSIVTTFYPLEGSMSLLANRAIEVPGGNTTPPLEYDVILGLAEEDASPLEGYGMKTFGRFQLLERIQLQDVP